MSSDIKVAITQFVDLVIESRDSGTKIFNDWLITDPVILKKCAPNFYSCFKSLSDQEIEKFNIIFPMVVGTSFYSLLEALEMGKDGLEFELKMKREGSEKVVELIESEVDHEIRNIVDVS